MLCSGLLAAVYPGAIGMSVVILSEAVFCPLMLVYFLCWQQGWKTSTQSRRWALGVGAGCAAGLAVLARPSWLLFAPFVFVIGITFGPQRARHTTIFIATLAGMVLTMSPWWVRNASVTGEFVLTTLQVGPSLYDGMHDGATGASDEGMAFMSRFAEEQLAEDATSSSLRSAFECSTFEYRLNRRAQRAAIEWMVTHPADVALLAWRKFLRTWSLWPNGGEVGSSTLRLLLTVGCFGVLALACVGSQSSWPLKLQLQVDGTSATFYWLPTAYFTLLHMIFVGSIRYREPALLVLTILAGIGLAKLTDRLMKNAAD